MGRRFIILNHEEGMSQHVMKQQNHTGKVTLSYLMHLPKDYGQDEMTYPLILFLHGAGERGDDIELIKKYGITHIVEE